jgi:hypothetical protein
MKKLCAVLLIGLSSAALCAGNLSEAEERLNRGHAYSTKGEPDRAIMNNTQTIRLNPNHADARDSLEILKEEGH